jgi:hypothetical protein
MNKRITATTNKRYNRKHGLKQKKKKVFRSGPTNVPTFSFSKLKVRQYKKKKNDLRDRSTLELSY